MDLAAKLSPVSILVIVEVGFKAVKTLYAANIVHYYYNHQ